MIKSLGQALRVLAGKPALLLPALLVVGIGMLLMIVALESTLNFAYDVFVLGIVPEATLFELPFKLAVMYPAQVLGLALFAAISFALSTWLAFVFANYAASPGSAAAGKLTASIKAAFSRSGGIIAYTVFAGIAVLLYLAAMGVLLAIAVFVPFIGLLALLLLIAQFLLGIYLVIRLYFTPVVMAAESLNVKEALKATWGWGSKRSAELLALMFVFAALGYALSGIGASFFDLIPEDDLVPGIGFAVIASIAVAYNNLAAAVYYSRKAKA